MVDAGWIINMQAECTCRGLYVDCVESYLMFVCLFVPPRCLDDILSEVQGLWHFCSGISITNYQLPNGLITVRRRWGQRHPQGANSGSNGKLELKLN
jgi:hypothetical protein